MAPRRMHYTNALLALRELGISMQGELLAEQERERAIARCEERSRQLQARAQWLYAAYARRPRVETWQQTHARHVRITTNVARLMRLVERNSDRLHALL